VSERAVLHGIDGSVQVFCSPAIAAQVFDQTRTAAPKHANEINFSTRDFGNGSIEAQRRLCAHISLSLNHKVVGAHIMVAFKRHCDAGALFCKLLQPHHSGIAP